MSRLIDRRFICLAMVLSVCLCGCTRLSSGPVPLACLDLTGPVWVGIIPYEPEPEWSEDRRPERPNFAIPQKQLPLIGKDRRLTIAGRQFDTDLPTGIRIHSAASHDGCGYLTVVSAKATVFLLRKQDHWYVTVASWSAENPSTVLRARFSFIPGLIYLLCDDDALAEELRFSITVQQDSDFTERVALTDVAMGMEGIPWAEPDEQLLLGAYRVDDSHRLHLLNHSGEEIVLPLPEPLAMSHRSGPRDDLAQTIFRVENHGILCHTALGWSLFSVTGQPLGYFPFPEILPGTWTDPMIRGHALYVLRTIGPHGVYYRLDPKTGTNIQEDPPPQP